MKGAGKKHVFKNLFLSSFKKHQPSTCTANPGHWQWRGGNKPDVTSYFLSTNVLFLQLSLPVSSFLLTLVIQTLSFLSFNFPWVSSLRPLSSSVSLYYCMMFGEYPSIFLPIVIWHFFSFFQYISAYFFLTVVPLQNESKSIFVNSLLFIPAVKSGFISGKRVMKYGCNIFHWLTAKSHLHTLFKGVCVCMCVCVLVCIRMTVCVLCCFLSGMICHHHPCLLPGRIFHYVHAHFNIKCTVMFLSFAQPW